MDIAICCIAYNRLDSLKRLLDSLTDAIYNDYKPSLIISIDKSNTDVVERFAKKYDWSHGKKYVVCHDENIGLRKHVLECGKYLDKYDALVVLEDDVTVSPYFFKYTMQCVEKYFDDERVAGISLYNFPVSYQTKLPFSPLRGNYDVYMMNCAQSWGQVWMQKQWKLFVKWYMENSNEFDIPSLPSVINSWPKSSWLKYHTRYCIENHKFFVYPYEALSTNNSDVGTHVKRHNFNVFQSVQQIVGNDFYRLPNFEECLVKYDGYFEPLFLFKWLNIDEDDLCVDINAQKNKCLYRRYVLTRKALPYKVIQTFSFSLRPLEANFFSHISGNDVFLYDTTVISNPPSGQSTYRFMQYTYNVSILGLIKRCGLKNIFRMLLKCL